MLCPRDLLDRLVAFPTVSSAPNRPLIEWVAEYLGKHGVEAHIHNHADDPDKAGLFAHVGPEVAGGVALSGHTDVVPVKGQAWSTDPFTVVEKDGRLYGRGTADMKGFDALAIWAMTQAKDLQRPLQIALSYDEEIGCTGAPPLIADMHKVLPPASDVIVGEPTMMKTVTGHKGGVTWWVHVHGFEVHSSLLHTGVSAIMYGAKLIDWANQLNAELMAQPPNATAALFDPPFTSAHVGQISGGTAHNITAKDCEFGFGFRVVPGESLDHWRKVFLEKVAQIEAEMQAIRPETRIEVTEQFQLPPFQPEANGSAEALVRRITGDNSDNFVSYGTEASHFQAAGHATVVCGPGDIAQAHQPDEYLSVSQLDAGQRFMSDLIAALR